MANVGVHSYISIIRGQFNFKRAFVFRMNCILSPMQRWSYRWVTLATFVFHGARFPPSLPIYFVRSSPWAYLFQVSWQQKRSNISTNTSNTLPTRLFDIFFCQTRDEPREEKENTYHDSIWTRTISPDVTLTWDFKDLSLALSQAAFFSPFSDILCQCSDLPFTVFLHAVPFLVTKLIAMHSNNYGKCRYISISICRRMQRYTANE
jgi:hypothetical protein